MRCSQEQVPPEHLTVFDTDLVAPVAPVIVSFTVNVADVLNWCHVQPSTSVATSPSPNSHLNDTAPVDGRPSNAQ
jgi:hypothetical protein